MSRTLLTAINLVTSLQTQSQNLTFGELLDIYEKGSQVELEDSTAFTLFGFERAERWSPFRTGTIIFKEAEYVALTVEAYCGGGSWCDKSVLVTMSYDGRLIDQAAFESEYGDCSWYLGRKNILTSDSLLIFTNIDQEWADCDDDESYEKNELQIEYVFINNGRFERPIIRKMDTRRKYLIGSTKFLNTDDLSDYSKEELAAVRNEIFAAHGYTFDTPKWQQYFSEQVWYKPIDKQIDKYLSMIERHNIEVLLKAERN